MIAALPMYDWPEVRAATDAWWAGLARHLRAAGLADVPEALCRDIGPPAVWEHPDLLLAQTCGLPFVRRYRDRLRIVATPCYAAKGCDGPTYRSAILVREGSAIDGPEATEGVVVAFNAEDSLSGHLALRLVLGGMRLGGAVETGSHEASMRTVRAGKADLCAVDCVSLAFAQRHRPELARGLRRIAWSPPMPALPYVTSAGRGADVVEGLRSGLQLAATDPELDAAREALLLGGVAVLPDDAYETVRSADSASPPLGLP
jgi:ABC-type phosphate/phosphonate transport system substrate-binding protein